MNRSDFEQEWQFDPAQEFPADAPRPWLVAGYSFKAVDNVLRVDYLAHRRTSSKTIYDVKGGEVLYIGHTTELRGMPHGRGTLFVLWPLGHDSSMLAKIIDDARVRVECIRDLASGPSK
jgi:hypothetical protein